MMSDNPIPGQGPVGEAAKIDPPAAIDMHAAALRLQSFLRALPGRMHSDAFGDAALMILLDLFVAEQERRRLPIKSVCIGSGVPQSTALRYIERLEAAALIRRHANPADRRSAHIALTDAAIVNLRAVLMSLFGEKPAA
jgi:hypothetical protein